MNKRQAKKKEKLYQIGMDWGFYRFPKYREITEMERGYHNFCINNYRAEREIERVLIGRKCKV